MPTVYDQFCSVLNTYGQAHSKFVLAFSGGIDSRVMLHLLARYCHEMNRQGIAVHVHHGLSPHADHWVESCRQWSAAAGLLFKVNYVSLDMHDKGSLESLARQARYEALQHHVGADDLLLTGQHSDDQLETFLLALKRGSGPKGLSSMGEVMPLSEGQLVRPLLKISRYAIEAYAHEHQLTWVEDESNQDTRFDRNFIRHQVSPVLMQRWPNLHQAVQRSAELCAEQESLLDELLNHLFIQALSPDGSLSIPVLLSLSDAARGRLLRMWLQERQQKMPSRIQLTHIYRQVILAKEDANPLFKLGSYEIRRFSGRLFCIPALNDLTTWEHRITFEQPLMLPDHLGILMLKEKKGGGLDKRKLENSSLRVSFNPEGLWASPVGRCGRQKLKKLFQEYHVPSWQRRRMPILMSGQQVIAIADLFVDWHYTGTDCDLIWEQKRR